MALFTQHVALTFKSLDERLWCDLRPLMKTLQVLQQYIHTRFFFFLRLWLKTYGVSIQIKITEKVAHVVLNLLDTLVLNYRIVLGKELERLVI